MKLMADKELPLYPIKTVLNFLQPTLQFKMAACVFPLQMALLFPFTKRNYLNCPFFLYNLV